MSFPTYDPYRKECEGWVAHLREQRRKRALKLREARKLFNEHFKHVTVQRRNQWVRNEAGRGSLVRTTTRALREYAMSNWRYTESDYGYGRYDSEYYSACGYDDYVSEKKAYARSVALEIWRTVGRFD